jgi:hypothetical protein
VGKSGQTGKVILRKETFLPVVEGARLAHSTAQELGAPYSVGVRKQGDNEHQEIKW